MIPGPSGWCVCDEAGTDQCTACRRSWQWDDGTALDYDEFHDWAGKEPDNKERCARLVSGGWAGRGCHYEYKYICKVG